MKNMLIIGAVVVAVLVIGVYFFIGVGSDQIEEEMENPPAGTAGEWSQQLKLVFKDGSTMNVPVEEGVTSQTLSWYYGDSPIDKIQYTLGACVKTDDISIIDVDFTLEDFSVEISRPGYSKTCSVSRVSSNLPVETISLDDYVSFTQIGLLEQTTLYGNPLFPSASGTYTFTFTPMGTINYKTNLMSSYESIDGPTEPITLVLEFRSTLEFYWQQGSSGQ